MKKYRAIFIVTYILLAVCGLAADYFYDMVPDVTLTKAQVGRVADTVTYTGTVMSHGTYVFSSVTARIDEIYVKNGQYVREGELLAQLDINDTVDHNLQNYLHDNISLDLSINEQSLSEIISAASQNEGYDRAVTTGAGVRAPISGYITTVQAIEGEYANPLMPLLVITDRSQMSIKVYVSEDRISEIKEGQIASITGSGFGGKTYYGRVEQIATYAGQSLINADGAKIGVTISLLYPDSSIMPGFTATVNVRVGIRDAVVQIPLEVIDQDESGQEYVWIYHNGMAQKQYISCRYTAYGYAEVDDFNSDLSIIETYSSPILDGMTVHLADGWKTW